MMTFFIFIAIGILVSFIVSYRDYCDVWEYFLYAILFAICGAFVGFFVALALPADSEKHTYTLELENLQDGSGVNGRFFLGSGMINSRMRYVFYYRDGEFYKMAQVDMSDAKIRYTESPPKAIVTTTVFSNTLLNNFAIDLSCDDDSYILEVPKGTIKSNFTLDAQ